MILFLNAMYSISKHLNFQLENPCNQDDDEEEVQGETNEIKR